MSFFSKSLAPSTVSECDTELRVETMSKECSRAGVKLGGQAQETLICGQATFQAAELPHLKRLGGQQGTGQKTICLTFEPTAVWFQLSTK